MAGAGAERQESGFIKAINDAVKKNKNNPVTVVTSDQTVAGVIKAAKFTGRQLGGSEPYTDVVLHLHNGKKKNLSLKGESAPSLAGGGLKGLELAVPGIAGKFMREAYNHLVRRKKLKAGDKVPDVYGKISPTYKQKIVVGNPAMGGPIDFMYIGPMDVKGVYNMDKNILMLNGAIIQAEEFAKTHDLYFRLRARREDQRFDPTAKQGNIPKIYGKSPSRGDSAGRIVVTDSHPNNAIIVRV